MSWSSSAGTEVDQGWREMHLLCWFMHIWCKAPLPFSPPFFCLSVFLWCILDWNQALTRAHNPSAVHLLPHVHILPWCVGLQCCHPSEPRQSLLVWVCIAKNGDKLMFGNLVTKSFLLAKDLMISLISSVAYPSLLSHFKEPKVQSKIVDWISSFCFLTQYFFIIFNFFILKRMWSQNNNNN